MEEERKWIKRIQKKQSKKDAELLVQKYYDEIYVYVYRQTGNKDDSLDLTQEIFISALHSIKNYQSDKASFRTWLYRVATNKIIDERRKKHPQFLDIEDIEVPEATVKTKYHRLCKKIRKEFENEYDNAE